MKGEKYARNNLSEKERNLNISEIVVKLDEKYGFWKIQSLYTWKNLSELQYSIWRIKLKRVNSKRDLGVIVDSKL